MEGCWWQWFATLRTQEYLNVKLSKDLFRGLIGYDAHCCQDLFYAPFLRPCSEYCTNTEFYDTSVI